MKKILLLSIFFTQTILMAQPYITVYGDAHFKVTPDIVFVNFDIVNEAQTPIVAKNRADEATKNLEVLFRDQNITAKDIELRMVGLNKVVRYEEYSKFKNKKVTLYEARRSVSVRLDRSKNYALFIDELIKIGVDSFYITLDSTKVKEKRQEARIAAIKNARAKAVDMAKAANKEVGEAIEIEEFDDNNVAIYNRALNNTRMVESYNDGVSNMGELDIGAVVKIKFELR